MQLQIMTVTGPVDPAELGLMLPHEHVMSTFGADPARYPEYDQEKLFDTVLAYLQRLKDLGVKALADCTAAYFGRHPEYLRRISQESGLRILTNTGYYGAARKRYIPAHAYQETPEKIAGRWAREYVDSIDGTGVFPGFIKTAVDSGPLSEIERKLIRAAALTHLQTGLTIQTHTRDNAAAAETILSILGEVGVEPSAWIWVHAHDLDDPAPAIAAAERGAWISLDGLNAISADHILNMLHTFKGRALFSRVLLSHDGDSYMNGESRPYHYLLTDFIPRMVTHGFTVAEIHALTIDNPARAFSIEVKR
jgi:predicted metal-dependent phosphotriesterase family hydrolase